ncbi:MAG: hypothetical protein ACFFEX_17560 [Candidatus Thorarchaeota archaeon]
MNQLNENRFHHVEQLMRLGAELIKLPSTASSVLSILYHQRCTGGEPLSMKTISTRSGLSVTTVSSLCTILESSGVLDKQAQFGKTGRGRKKLLFSMRMGLHEFLSYCVTRHLKEIERLHREMKNVEPFGTNSELNDMVVSKAQIETEQFLLEYSIFRGEKDYSRPLARSDQDCDEVDANVEGTF